MTDNPFRIFLHSVFYPFQNQSHKPIFIKVCNKCLIFLIYHDAVRPLINNSQQQPICNIIEKSCQNLPAVRIVDVSDKILILPDIVKDLQISLLPCRIASLPRQTLCIICQKCPFHQIINVFKMIIKRLAVDGTRLYDIHYGYFV